MIECIFQTLREKVKGIAKTRLLVCPEKFIIWTNLNHITSVILSWLPAANELVCVPLIEMQTTSDQNNYNLGSMMSVGYQMC